MNKNSIRKQLFNYILTSFILVCGLLLIFFITKGYLEKKQTFEIESNKMLLSSLKQVEQLVPGILVKEEYGSIDLQLKKIIAEEQLVDAQLIKPDEKDNNSFLTCSKLGPQSYLCSDVMAGKLNLATEIRVSNELLGYLLKTKIVDFSSSNNFSFLSLLFIGITLIFIYLLLSIFIFIENKVRKPLLNLQETLSPILEGKSTSTFETNFIEELQSVSIQVQQIIKKYEEKMAASVMIDISMQVSHDIRSPLSALNSMLGQMAQMPEPQRVLMRSATQRINDIANQLLEKGKQIQKQMNSKSIESEVSNQQQSLSTQLLSPIIDSIISEKRIQFREKQGVEVDSDLSQGYGLFAKINIAEFKRTISNLLNNSIEAFPETIGRVNISVINEHHFILVKIQDNGIGIPKHILEKLGQTGVTHGKEGTQSGSGLGIYHAKRTIENFGGKFTIDSTPGVGTSINIYLIKDIAPSWFVESIVLTDNLKIVSLDDDISIHQIWKSRIDRLSMGNSKFEHITFTSGLEFKNWYKTNNGYSSNAKSERLYLIDFELLNQNATGLDIIEELGIAATSILVTSRFEEENIIKRCEKLGLKLIPKPLAAFVPLKIEKPKMYIDSILVDDDDLVHSVWNMDAKEKNKKFLGFYRPIDFIERAEEFDLNSKIFVDSNLGYGIKGEVVSKKIYDLGFKNIYICTGYQASEFPVMPWVKDIIGKDPQF